MGAKLYKYLGSEALSKAFSEQGIGSFKCSQPKDFNDPYELFLTIDYNQHPEILAYYKETVGQIPQRPTTCFSKSPEVIPMWAHYAENHRGVVIEVDEELLLQHLPEIAFGDVDYRSEPDAEILDLLLHAHMTCKPRHVYFLQSAVRSAAYYTKNSCWSYEQERRLVAPPSSVADKDGLMLLRFPSVCVTALISGHRADDQTKQSTKQLAEEIGCNYYQMRIGRSLLKPFFQASNSELSLFSDGTFFNSVQPCQTCKEPARENAKMCSWCSIEQAHSISAAQRNPMRMLDRYGLLQDYYKDADKIRNGQSE